MADETASWTAFAAALVPVAGCAEAPKDPAARASVREGTFPNLDIDIVACVSAGFCQQHPDDHFDIGRWRAGHAVVVSPDASGRPVDRVLDAETKQPDDTSTRLEEYPTTHPGRYSTDAIWRVVEYCGRRPRG